MNPKRLADALNTISMGFAEAAEALSDTPAAVGSPAGQGREVQPAPPGSPAPPYQMADRDRMLAECPVHQKPWTVKEGGISRNGKPYSAFWKCDNKNPDGSWCDKKPDKGWAASHDPEQAIMALPF